MPGAHHGRTSRLPAPHTVSIFCPGLLQLAPDIGSELERELELELGAGTGRIDCTYLHCWLAGVNLAATVLSRNLTGNSAPFCMARPLLVSAPAIASPPSEA